MVKHKETLVVFCPALLRGEVSKALSTREIARGCHAARLPLVYFPYDQKFASRTAGSSDKSNAQILTTLCGQKIHFDGREATIALTLQTDYAGVCALTVNHLFIRQTQPILEFEAIEEDPYFDDAGLGRLHTPSWLMDVQYDDDAEIYLDTVNLQYTAVSEEVNSREESSLEVAYKGPSLSDDEDIVQPSSDSPWSYVSAHSKENVPYLDWALIDLEELGWPILPNLVIDSGGQSHIVSEVVSKSLLRETIDVLVVTAGKIVVEGILHPSYGLFANPDPHCSEIPYTLGRAQVMTFLDHGVSDLSYVVGHD